MTANDSDVSDGDTLTGSQVVRVYGENLTAPFVTLTFGNVEYIPLAQGEGYIEFILSDNGAATISVDGSPFMSFEIAGATRPAGLPTRFQMSQRDGNLSNAINVRTANLANCINYPFVKTEDHPVFFMYMGSATHPFTDLNDFVGHNCNVTNKAMEGENQIRMAAVVTAGYQGAAYITYKDFVVAVFNYTTN